MSDAKRSWGGSRANTGGKRPGAGRKPKPKPEKVAIVPPAKAPDGEPKSAADVLKAPDMLKLLQDVALGLIDASPIQVRAAIAAVQYTHTKRGDGGKKEEAEEKAKSAGAGKFGPKAPPLRVVGAK